MFSVKNRNIQSKLQDHEELILNMKSNVYPISVLVFRLIGDCFLAAESISPDVVCRKHTQEPSADEVKDVKRTISHHFERTSSSRLQARR